MTRVAIIGAGPYGLSVAAHLRAAGVEYRIFGKPLDNWIRHMPVGMMLKSQPFASSLSGPSGSGTLDAYCAGHGIAYHPVDIPVSLELFTAYGLDFQRRFVPDLDQRQVVALDRKRGVYELTLDDGSVVSADLVVAAVGITYFGELPAVLQGLSADLVSHSWAHADLSVFSGKDVTVVGAGASAVDIATLLYEAGARPSLISRSGRPKFYPPAAPGPRSIWQRIAHPSAALGPSLRFWLYERRPSLFRYLPARLRLAVNSHALGPATPSTMQSRFEAGVEVFAGESIGGVTQEQDRLRLVLRGADGSTRETTTDHVIAATGYPPKLSSVGFISDGLRSTIRTYAQMPVLSSYFESSADGLFFVGLPALGSFGPLMRFVAGAGYAAPRLAGELARRAARLGPVSQPSELKRVAVA